jgi:hypothetical protein
VAREGAVVREEGRPLVLASKYQRLARVLAEQRGLSVTLVPLSGSVELAARLGADVEEIEDTRSRRGLWGWLMAGRDASKKSKTVIGPTKLDPAEYDLVILGTPVWAWNMTPAIRTYILANRDRFKQVAFFCTMGKNGDVKTFAGMADLCGRKPVATMALRTEEVKIRQFNTGLNKFMSDLDIEKAK